MVRHTRRVRCSQIVKADLEHNQVAEVRILEESEPAVLEQNQAAEVHTLGETVIADEHDVQATPAARALVTPWRRSEPRVRYGFRFACERGPIDLAALIVDKSGLHSV